MRLLLLFKTSMYALIANKVRSGLTILGIVIGIAAIILIVSIGKGAEGLVLSELGNLGADLIVIRPGQEPTGPTDIAETIFSDSIKAKDIEALKRKENVPYLLDIAPAIVVTGSVSYRGETYRPQIFGWSAEFMAGVFDVYPERGVIFTDLDIRQKASVAVIGKKVEDELFGNEDAVGKNIKIKDRNFRVVGVLPKRGQSSLFNIDEVVVIPYTSAQTYLSGGDFFNEVMVRASDPSLVARTVRDIEATLRESHDITDPDKDDFFVVTQEGLVDQVGTILSILTAFLSSVVAISLVVGGIGVMNIMLVSVTERTKEIGLRKAIGATNKDIMRQFLLEAVLLTFVGGVIGLTIGLLFSYGISVVLSTVVGLSWSFKFPIVGALLGVGVSALVGILFGIYPAQKAAQKSPIDALRYE